MQVQNKVPMLPRAGNFLLLPSFCYPSLQAAPGCLTSFRCWMQVNAGQKYQVDYACSCCGLFGGSGDCCQPLDSCSYLTPSCGTTKPATQAFLVSTFQSLQHLWGSLYFKVVKASEADRYFLASHLLTPDRCIKLP